MPHPIMFSDDDPVLNRLREVALAFPDATEVVAHGRPTFRGGKMFGMYGGGVKGGPQFETSLLFKVGENDRAALEQDARFFYPAYVGPYGWLGLDLSKKPDWREVAELLDASYRLIAPKKLIARLDDGERPAELR
ncbi:phosphoribosylglycinamide formyltransferase [Williamsia sp. 1138]|uniref:MmcQ/YjbR family DNA-binding protein n=1 Tax=Williamsia sp. 1138 TaxID=1903117 RepID=UPI000A1136AA|nr:MmcQ/YjbR family DNA-binding protein [Williamsia sp. 1138]OZG28620.1 phosphoribosylglycinamide formyltransferase [Williamsia sp. 1138]